MIPDRLTLRLIIYYYNIIVYGYKVSIRDIDHAICTTSGDLVNLQGLCARYVYIMCMLCVYYVHVMCILCACYVHVTVILRACYVYVMCMLCAR